LAAFPLRGDAAAVDGFGSSMSGTLPAGDDPRLAVQMVAVGLQRVADGHLSARKRA